MKIRRKKITQKTPSRIRKANQVPPDCQYNGLKQLFREGGLLDAAGQPTDKGLKALEG